MHKLEKLINEKLSNLKISPLRKFEFNFEENDNSIFLEWNRGDEIFVEEIEKRNITELDLDDLARTKIWNANHELNGDNPMWRNVKGL